jgi:hypothetical protein
LSRIVNTDPAKPPAAPLEGSLGLIVRRITRLFGQLV